jgi:hypothetical protein
MLPVYVDKLASAKPVRDAQLQLSREGWLEPWTRLRPEQAADESRIAVMPSFFAVNQTASIKPGATVLASLVDKQERTMPALVTQKFGNGRVLAYTIGDVWRWGMKDSDQQTDMQKHWRQLVRHLVVDVPDRVTLSTTPGEDETSRVIQVRVKDKTFAPQDDAAVTLTVEHSRAGTEKQQTTIAAQPSLKEPGLYEASYSASAGGSYLVRSQVTDVDGTRLTDQTLGWALNPAADELRTLSPDRGLWHALAERTGGQLLESTALNTVPSLLSQLDAPATDRKVTPLWHQPGFLIALIGLLCGEWFIRRRSGWI